MVLELGDFRYLVRRGPKPRLWAWVVYAGSGAGEPICEGEFHGSEGRAHMAAREAIARLREGRFRAIEPAEQTVQLVAAD